MNSKSYTLADLTEAKRQLESLHHKLLQTIDSLEHKATPDRHRSQITLAQRRVYAIEISLSLIQDAMNEAPSSHDTSTR